MERYYELNLKDYTQMELAEISRDLCKEFLKLNKIPNPMVTLWVGRNEQGDNCGLYTPGLVQVWVPNTARISWVPNMTRWSYPGYKVDRTPIGVVAHEVGHYVDDRLCLSRGMDIRNGEKITNYEPSKMESFAETMRVFILNPDLLKAIAPNRYRYLEQSGLKPLIKDDWETVLGKADIKYHNAVRGLISKIK